MRYHSPSWSQNPAKYSGHRSSESGDLCKCGDHKHCCSGCVFSLSCDLARPRD